MTLQKHFKFFMTKHDVYSVKVGDDKLTRGSISWRACHPAGESLQHQHKKFDNIKVCTRTTLCPPPPFGFQQHKINRNECKAQCIKCLNQCKVASQNCLRLTVVCKLCCSGEVLDHSRVSGQSPGLILRYFHRKVMLPCM